MNQAEQFKQDGDFPATVSNVPIGTVMMYAGKATGAEAYLEQNGWLVCDGRSLNQEGLYSELYEVLKLSYGYEDDDTFYIPDCRGLFVRGVDMGSENDPDAAERTAQDHNGNTGDKVGTCQTDEIKSHYHNLNLRYKNGSEAYANTADSSTSKSQTGSTASKGGNETRPKNISMYYIIKFKIVD